MNWGALYSFCVFLIGTAITATFDPTNLENGGYSLRLIGYQCGGAYFTTPATVITADGPHKVGPFGVAFEDYTLPARGQPFNCLNSIKDPLGHTTTFSYDGNGNLLTMTDALGQPMTLTYSSDGQLTTMTDAVGTTTSYTHHPNTGVQLSQTITGVDGKIMSHQTYLHDANGRQIEVRDHQLPAGAESIAGATLYRRTQSILDSAGRVKESRTLNAAGTLLARTLTTHDANGKPLTSTDPLNRTTTQEYDPQGRTVKTTYPDGTFTITAYDPEGRATHSTDQLGRTIITQYDALGRTVKVTAPDATFTTSTYDPAGRMTASTEALGHTTQSEYDAAGRMIKSTAPDGSFTESVYDNAGRVTTSKDARGNATTYTYDAAGRTLTVANALNQVTTSTYNAAGQRTHVTDALGRVTQTLYDGASRQIGTILPDGKTEATAYDFLGRRVSSTDAAGRTTLYEYDTQGRMTAVVDALGHRTEYTFDAAGQQLTQKDALGRITSYLYNVMGHRTHRILPGGQAETYSYDLIGNPVTHIDFNGFTTTHVYHPLTSRLLSKSADPAHPSLTLPHAARSHHFAYDAAGKRTAAEVRNNNGTVLHSQSWAFDNRNRMITHAQHGATLTYAHDADSNLLSTTSSTPGGYGMTYSYDALNRLSTAADINNLNPVGQPATTNYTYTGVGALATTSLPNGLTHSYAYNSRNQLLQLSTSKISNQQTAILNQFTYTLAATGHRLTEQSTRAFLNQAPGTPNQERLVNYAYDILHRLTGETVADSNGPSGTVGYTLDAVSNRPTRSSTLPGVTAQTQSVDSNDRLTTDTTDANGNTLASLLAGNTVTDIYDFENRLIRRTVPSGKTIDLLYDTDGHRTAKSVQTASGTKTTRYFVDTQNPTGYAQVIEEHTTEAAATNLTAVYAYGHDLISQPERLAGAETDCSIEQPLAGEGAVRRRLNPHRLTASPAPGAWNLSYFLYDGGGHVRALSDATGEITDTYAYDAYGILIAQTGTTENNYLYRGEQYDPDLRLYNQRARYLNPETGRFWTQDTYEGDPGTPATLHKYLYANSDPVMGWDPSGNFTMAEAMTSLSIKFVLARMAVGSVYGLVDGLINGESGSGLVWNIAMGALGGAYGGPFIRGLISRGGIAKLGAYAVGGLGALTQVSRIVDNVHNGEAGRATWNTFNLGGVIALKRLLSFKGMFSGMAARLQSPTAVNNGVGLAGVVDIRTGLVGFSMTADPRNPNLNFALLGLLNRNGTHRVVADRFKVDDSHLLGFAVENIGGRLNLIWRSGQLNRAYPGNEVPDSLREMIRIVAHEALGTTLN